MSLSMLSDEFVQKADEQFYEACSALYNDILDALDHNQEVNETEILGRHMEIMKKGDELSEAIPQLSNIISSKLTTVGRAMEHLRLNRQSLSDASSKDDREPTALSELRKWVHGIDDKINAIEANCTKVPITRKELERLAADQQILQLQIETEGRSFTENVQQRNVRVPGLVDSLAESCVRSKRERTLKALVQRWYHLWLRSLSVQCRIEHLLNQQTQSDDLVESDSEVREPLLKRRRFSDANQLSIDKLVERGDQHLLELKRDHYYTSQEDIIPFAEDEYESIELSTAMLQSEAENCDIESRSSVKVDAPKHHQYRIIHDQSSFGGSRHSSSSSSSPPVDNSCSLTAIPPNSNETPMFADSEAMQVDDGRRLRIQLSPVKSFYKMVPLDDNGATDTETPRVSMSSWRDNQLLLSGVEIPHVLTDSLIVNTDESIETDSTDNIKEIMLMLDERADTELEPSVQGTRWREFHSGKQPLQLPFGQLPVEFDENNMNSCDASSEESDDMDTSGGWYLKVSPQLSNSLSDSRQNSLKRRRKPRAPQASSTNTAERTMTASVCSAGSLVHSELGYPSAAFTSSFSGQRNPDWYFYAGKRNHTRRKLRARRLPRSMSDGEQLLGLGMSASTYLTPSTRASTVRDSDATAPEQSDAPPYEWDDYNPPAKSEDDWENDPDDMSVLTVEDDFQLHLGRPLPISARFSNGSTRRNATEKRRNPNNINNNNMDQGLTPTKERPIVAVTGKLGARMMMPDENWNMPDYMKINGANDGDNDGRLRAYSVNTRTSSSTDDSPLPMIMAKIKKLAGSLKLMQEDHNSSSSSLSTFSSIKSLGDVVSTLKIFNEIHERLMEEQNELRRLLSSESLSGDLSGLADEFRPLADGYTKAIAHVEQLRCQIEKIHEHWSDWADTQHNMQTLMHDIENELTLLRKGGDNSEQICSELELCQERMNRLETVCNYLTSSLCTLHDNASNPPVVDFTSELALYSNALIQLKAKFEIEIRQTSTADKATWMHTRKRSVDRNAMDCSPQPTGRLPSHSLLALLALAILTAIAACIATGDVAWLTTLGPHLKYVNGPPPV